MQIAPNYIQVPPKPSQDGPESSETSYDFQVDRTVGKPQKGDTIIWNGTTYTITNIDHESEKSIWVSAEVAAE